MRQRLSIGKHFSHGNAGPISSTREAAMSVSMTEFRAAGQDKRFGPMILTVSEAHLLRGSSAALVRSSMTVAAVLLGR